MDNAVVVLGAGASADFGLPTLAGMFIDEDVKNYLRSNSRLREALERYFWRIRGNRNLSVEQMLTLLRDWELEPGLPHEKRPLWGADFRRDLYCLIQRAVFVGKSSKSAHLNPIISYCAQHFQHTTWASFNWDCTFEASFWYSRPPGQRVNPSIGLEHLENWRTGIDSHLYLKLHGGINWWSVDGRLEYLHWASDGPIVDRWASYEYDVGGTGSPIILEPSYHKYADAVYKLLEPQWDNLFTRLLAAKIVIFIGYSLPEADQLARAKILTAFQTNLSCKWVLIDPSRTTGARYKTLLGKRSLTVFRERLSDFNTSLADKLDSVLRDQLTAGGRNAATSPRSVSRRRTIRH